jgi:membrane dipeptidase
MIVYVGQSSPPQVADAFQPSGYDRAYKAAVAKFDAIHHLTKEIAPGEIGLALTAADVVSISKSGRKVAVIGIENGYPIGTDIGRVKEFWERGGRYMSLAHNGHSQLADSNTGEADNKWMWGGLSPLGKQVIQEMNKWGIMVDVSHPSKGSMMQAIGLSKAPVIASHSAVRSLANHSRNLDDEQLMAIKTNGGVAQIVAFASYVKTDPAERAPAIAALRQEFALPNGRGGGGRAAGPPVTPPCPLEGTSPAPGAGRGGRGAMAGLDTLTPERRAAFSQRLAEIDRKWPAAPRATVKDFVDHIDYAVKLIGIDHVGISSDFDGGGGVDGWNSAAETFNVTLELVRRGYTEEQIGKIWSGNLLRVWAREEARR